MYVKSDTLLLADVFENFRKMCLEFYQLDPAKFLSAPGLAWLADFKKTKVELELWKSINMFLMTGKGIREGICNFNRYAKANNKCLKDQDKNKELWDVNNFYG